MLLDANFILKGGGKLCFIQGVKNFPKAVKTGFQVLDDLFCQFIGFRKIVEVGKALVLEPENIEAGFVTGEQFLIGVLAPAAIRMLVSMPAGIPTSRLYGGLAYSSAILRKIR